MPDSAETVWVGKVLDDVCCHSQRLPGLGGSYMAKDIFVSSFQMLPSLVRMGTWGMG